MLFKPKVIGNFSIIKVPLPAGVPRPISSGRIIAEPMNANWVVTMSNWVMKASLPLTEMVFRLAAAWSRLTFFSETFRLSLSCWYHDNVWLIVLK